MWFGDERGYNATELAKLIIINKLWFGDERGYNATSQKHPKDWHSCGLVMKEDITQHTGMTAPKTIKLWFGDERGYNATYPIVVAHPIMLWFGDERGYNATDFERMPRRVSCGLVMKEDITQRLSRIT